MAHHRTLRPSGTATPPPPRLRWPHPDAPSPVARAWSSTGVSSSADPWATPAQAPPKTAPMPPSSTPASALCLHARCRRRHHALLHVQRLHRHCERTVAITATLATIARIAIERVSVVLARARARREVARDGMLWYGSMHTLGSRGVRARPRGSRWLRLDRPTGPASSAQECPWSHRRQTARADARLLVTVVRELRSFKRRSTIWSRPIYLAVGGIVRSGGGASQ